MKIGILGGIGPQTSAKFYMDLILKMQKLKIIKKNEEYPQIIINSIPAPELIHHKNSKKDISRYIKGLKELDSLGPDFIVITCNTIHLYLKLLQKEINAPIINLREEIYDYLNKKKIDSFLIIGTPETIKSGLYYFRGKNAIIPKEKDIKKLANAIKRFNIGWKNDKQIEIVKNICLKYINNKDKNIIAGCTELALMLKKTNLNIIDPMDILVDKIIEKFKHGFN